jgi:hypothetical protein
MTIDIVITAFLEPWPVGTDGSKRPLLEQISIPIKDDVRSLEAMIFHITSKCIEFLDGPDNGGLIENWLGIFEQSIATQVSCPESS